MDHDCYLDSDKRQPNVRQVNTNGRWTFYCRNRRGEIHYQTSHAKRSREPFLNSSSSAKPSLSTNNGSLTSVRQDVDLVEDIVYAFRPLAIWCPPIRKPAADACHWVRRSGSAELRLTCNPRYGLPYGQDRLVLILLATLSVMQNVQTVSFTSAYEVLRKFGQ